MSQKIIITLKDNENGSLSIDTKFEPEITKETRSQSITAWQIMIKAINDEAASCEVEDEE